MLCPLELVRLEALSPVPALLSLKLLLLLKELPLLELGPELLLELLGYIPLVEFTIIVELVLFIEIFELEMGTRGLRDILPTITPLPLGADPYCSSWSNMPPAVTFKISEELWVL